MWQHINQKDSSDAQCAFNHSNIWLRIVEMYTQTDKDKDSSSTTQQPIFDEQHS